MCAGSTQWQQARLPSAQKPAEQQWPRSAAGRCNAESACILECQLHCKPAMVSDAARSQLLHQSMTRLSLTTQQLDSPL